MVEELRVAKDVLALVLAAGLSTRMGQPKLLLDWGGKTVLQTVLLTLHSAGIERIYTVVGANREAIQQSILSLTFPVRTVFNPDYSNGEMTDSIKVGIKSVPRNAAAVLIVLGDQPQMEVEVVKGVLDFYKKTGAKIIVPSYQFRRGHPWLIEKSLWGELENLSPSYTMRDFLRKHHDEIRYIEVETPTVLQDLDTPQDYQRLKPE
ncbi:MAG: NTP transferase domain-containing protein [Bellilinea sp.]